MDLFHIKQTGLASERANVDIVWPIYLLDHLSTLGLKSTLIELLNEGRRCSTKYILCKLLVKNDFTEREGRADGGDLKEDISNLFTLADNLINDFVGQQSDR